MTMVQSILDALVEAAGDVKTLLKRSLPAGGSTGQVLTKKSGADYDAGWVAAPAGGGTVYQIGDIAAGTPPDATWVRSGALLASGSGAVTAEQLDKFGCRMRVVDGISPIFFEEDVAPGDYDCAQTGAAYLVVDRASGRTLVGSPQYAPSFEAGPPLPQKPNGSDAATLYELSPHAGNGVFMCRATYSVGGATHYQHYALPSGQGAWTPVTPPTGMENARVSAAGHGKLVLACSDKLALSADGSRWSVVDTTSITGRNFAWVCAWGDGFLVANNTGAGKMTLYFVGVDGAVRVVDFAVGIPLVTDVSSGGGVLAGQDAGGLAVVSDDGGRTWVAGETSNTVRYRHLGCLMARFDSADLGTVKIGRDGKEWASVALPAGVFSAAGVPRISGMYSAGLSAGVLMCRAGATDKLVYFMADAEIQLPAVHPQAWIKVWQ